MATAIILFFPASALAQAGPPQVQPHRMHAAAAASTRPPMRLDARRFGERVQSLLQTADAQRAEWGILVVDRDSGATIYELNSAHFFTPASNAKLFTTALALATLGPDYIFRTTLESQGMLAGDGRLSGDLVLTGRGDPDISNRKFPYAGGVERDGPVDKVLAEMADQAVAKGLREVDGDIVGDDSYFPYDPYPAEWTMGDLFFEFGAPVSAITFNDNTISVSVSPAVRAGDAASVVTEPNVALDTFGQEITTGPPGSESQLAVVRQPGQNFILLRGTIAADHAPMNLNLAMLAPAETAARTLKQLLEERGVFVTGTARAMHSPPPESTPSGEPIFPPSLPAPTSAAAFVFAEHVSAPLVEVIRATNKVSQNLHAELLLRTVAREKTGVGSTAAGLSVERGFLRSAGITDGDVILNDGSGLARDDLVTPRAVVTLLQYAARQPWGEEFMATLPIAGLDGTLENRMRHTAAAGLIEAKTGDVEHVRGLSGYATTLKGENLTFSIFYNNNPKSGPETAGDIDAIATAMVETLGEGHSSGRKK